MSGKERKVRLNGKSSVCLFLFVHLFIFNFFFLAELSKVELVKKPLNIDEYSR